MSEEQLKAFWEAVQADTSLQEKLRATTDADSIASIAKEAGFEITADEVKEAQSELLLSDEQLKGVVGGGLGWRNWAPGRPGAQCVGSAASFCPEEKDPCTRTCDIGCTGQWVGCNTGPH